MISMRMIHPKTEYEPRDEHRTLVLGVRCDHNKVGRLSGRSFDQLATAPAASRTMATICTARKPAGLGSITVMHDSRSMDSALNLDDLNMI